MSRKVAELMTCVRAYIAKPTKGRFSKANDAVVSLSDLSEKKRTRDAAREALLEIVRIADPALAGSAMSYLTMVPLLSADDVELLPLIEERLALVHDHDYAYMSGMLAILGREAYREAVRFVGDTTRSTSSRSAVLGILEGSTGIDFARDIHGKTMPEIGEEHYHLDELAQWENNGFVLKPAAVPVDALAAYGIELKTDYRQFLLQHRGRDTYEFKGQQWTLLSALQLCNPIKIDGRAYPAFRQLEGFARALKAFISGDATADQQGNPYSVERLSKGIAIGSSDSGNIVYIDPLDKSSIWIFHPDGGDVEKVGNTFTTWKKKCRKA